MLFEVETPLWQSYMHKHRALQTKFTYSCSKEAQNYRTGLALLRKGGILMWGKDRDKVKTLVVGSYLYELKPLHGKGDISELL